jgi:prephenate dehydrogenase
MTDVLVLGTGLIGTSVGLALRQAPGYRVLLADQDARARDAAVGRGAGTAWDGVERAHLVVAAVPPAAIGLTLFEVQRLGIGETYTHVSSVQSHVQAEVEILGCDLSTIVGGHPLAGRETSGPGGASADLFVGRPWALCPSGGSSAAALADVRALATACGATPLIIDAQEHDAAVALLSHLPQVVSSALAALLVAPGPAVRTDLAGSGIVDTTRLAGSDPVLWTEILAANASEVAPAVRSLAGLLDAVARDLEQVAAGESPSGHADALAGVTALLATGNRGRALLPVKRGVRDEAFARVVVEVDDRPGRLAALLTDAGRAGVNVEDVRVDHIPGRPRGVIELLVANEAAGTLQSVLSECGWSARVDG